MDDEDEELQQSDDEDSEHVPWHLTKLPQELVDSEIFRFNIKLPASTLPVVVNMFSDLDIDYDILLQQMEDHPSIYIYWAGVYSEARSLISKKERLIRSRKGAIAGAAVAGFAKAKAKLTDKQLFLILDKDKTTQQLEDELADLHKTSGKLWHMVKALEMKAELMRSLAGFKRQEFNESR